MIYEKKNIGKAKAELTLYLHEKVKAIAIAERPLILICPGGGYEHTSKREGEPVALEFMARGYHAAVLEYSCSPHAYPEALLELAEAVRYFRKNAKALGIDKNRIYLTGFSAGGHLVAEYTVKRKDAFVKKAFGEGKSGCFEVNGLILGYPVITSGEYAHKGSFENLLGKEYKEKKDEHSLEKLADAAFPRTFIWSTTEDGSVPVENSLLFYSALKKAGVSAELHIFEHGSHGLSLADERTGSGDPSKIEKKDCCWMDMACTFLGPAIS